MLSNEAGLRRRKRIVVVVLAVATASAMWCAAGLAQSDSYRRFPGEAVDNRTLSTQQKVEELYANGAYQRALLIYEKELAPIGDKYAQYMVGYMYLAGQGAAPDKSEALAWYRLAAERGESALVEAKDALQQSLDPDELARSEEIFADLWHRYSDRRLLLELIAKDLDILHERTGSRIPDARPGVTIVSGYFGSQGSEEFYRDVRERLERRIRYLEAATASEKDIKVPEDSGLERLEDRVEQGLKALNSP